MIDKINSLVENKWIANIISSVLVIIISIVIYRSIVFVISKNDKFKSLSTKKGKTHIKMIKSIIRYTFVIITTLVVFQINGINVTSMLAGVGIIGIVIGFAVQDALKDIIKGIDIIMDSYYQVGDVIKYNQIEGKVLSIGLKTTKVEDLRSLNIVSISNRNIEEVEVVSNLININIPLPYELKVDYAEKVLKDIVLNVSKIDKVDNTEYRGIQELADSSIDYQIKVYCNPYNKFQIRRDVLVCIVKTLEKHNISIPYNQIDIHNKK